MIGVPDEEFGQRLKAFVVTPPGCDADPGRGQGHVRDHLARYKVPAYGGVRGCPPRTTTGKLRRLDLS